MSGPAPRHSAALPRHFALLRADAAPSIEWRGTACGDVIRSGKRPLSIFGLVGLTLSRYRPPDGGPSEVAATLRDIRLSTPLTNGSYLEHASPTMLSAPCCRRGGRPGRAWLRFCGGHPREDPRRQKRLDQAFQALKEVVDQPWATAHRQATSRCRRSAGRGARHGRPRIWDAWCSLGDGDGVLQRRAASNGLR